MTQLTVSLPDSVQKFVEDEAAAGGFANAVDFVRDLICQAYRDKAQRELEAKVQEGLDALDRGEGTEMTAADWARLRAEFLIRHSHRNGS